MNETRRPLPSSASPFRFVCSRQWADLEIDPSDLDRRFCIACKLWVDRCRDADSFAEHRDAGRCVSIEDPDEMDVVTTGLPDDSDVDPERLESYFRSGAGTAPDDGLKGTLKQMRANERRSALHRVIGGIRHFLQPLRRWRVR